jgi:hypothetical protein
MIKDGINAVVYHIKICHKVNYEKVWHKIRCEISSNIYRQVNQVENQVKKEINDEKLYLR